MSSFEEHRLKSFDGVELAYYERGRGSTVVLLHGFAADTERNWAEPGIVGALLDAGHRVVALDARGHGRSEKPHDPAAYANAAMVRDVERLLEHLGTAAHVCGYSMGALTALRLAERNSSLSSVVLGGIGAGVLVRGVTRRAPDLADALLVDDPSTIDNPTARAFRAFADATGADRAALAAMQRARAVEAAPHDPPSVDVPTLVIVGRGDELVGDPAPLAEVLGAELVVVPGSHLTAVYAPSFAEAIVGFVHRYDAT